MQNGSLTDRIVTVFGGSGFIGRYVVQALCRAGARVRVANRSPRAAFFLRTQGGIGQTQFVAADVRRPETVARALAGAWGAVNLVGVLAGDFEAFHVEGARNVAAAARDAGVEALVQVSALGADLQGPSRYAMSKARGEAAVLDAFPDAVILRPSVVFGREDAFVNRFARIIRWLPVVPVVGPGARFQPVYVGDVAQAVAAALAGSRRFAGRTFELGGPEVITMLDLNRRIGAATGRRRVFVPLPDELMGPAIKTLGGVPGAPITHDQWLSLMRGSVVEGPDGLAALGVHATPFDAVTEGWLVRYRREGRFSLLQD